MTCTLCVHVCTYAPYVRHAPYVRYKAYAVYKGYVRKAPFAMFNAKHPNSPILCHPQPAQNVRIYPPLSGHTPL